MKRDCWVLLIGIALLAAGASRLDAHPADVGHLRVDVSRQHLEVRLTFNLATLQRFAEMDADHSGSISHAELSAAIPVVEGTLRGFVRVSINDLDSTLGTSRPFHCVWPDPEIDVPLAEYIGRFVDLTFVWNETDVIEDVWIGFDLFNGPNDLLTIQGRYQQQDQSLEVEFSALEPEFLYDTGYLPGKSLEPPPQQAQPEQDVFAHPVLRMTFALMCLAAVVSSVFRMRHYWGKR